MHPAKWQIWTALCISALIVVFAALWVLRWQGRTDFPGGSTETLKGITSTGFANGSSIPQRFTCDGANISPELHLPKPPKGTTSFAIVMDDPDVPFGFVHWLLYDVPTSTRDIVEGASPKGSLPPGAEEGVNDFGSVGYAGPCPPGGNAHHYRLRVYALELEETLQPGMTKNQLAAKVSGEVLAQGQLRGSYARQDQ